MTMLLGGIGFIALSVLIVVLLRDQPNKPPKISDNSWAMPVVAALASVGGLIAGSGMVVLGLSGLFW